MQGYRYAHGDRPLDGYTIHYALGRGGFGEVYFAVSDAGREVALKAIQNYEEVELRGIGHCMNLKSPHLVTIFDVKHDAEERPWVIMEYVSGPSLNEILDEATDATGKRIGVGHDQALYFTRELIKGLRYLHDAGVVHRDLKPHNIFFEDGAVKIGDYSLSKAISTSHRSSHTTTVGSVHYMAPEIGEGNYGKAVDVYALGVILFELLTGTPPYVGESMGEVLIKHLTSEPDVSAISAPFAQTIRKAMARKPEDRFQSVEEMLIALCPEDHSSYLPPPASLSMIGDSAKRSRLKNEVATQAHLMKPPQSKPPQLKPPRSVRGNGSEAAIVETATAYESLVDTREKTDSQPFERPGIVMPPGTRNVLQTLGLWWKRSDKPITGKEQVGLGWRTALALVTSTAFVGLLALLLPMHLLDFVALVVTTPLVGGIFCWVFLQTLPRNDTTPWSAWMRVAAAMIIVPTTMIWLAAMDELNAGKWHNGVIPAMLAFSFALDWRCFIAADRYPRVGIWKTLMAVGLMMTILTFMGAGNQQALSAAVLCAAVIVTIQILAPQAQVISNRADRHRANDSSIDPTTEKSMTVDKPSESRTATQAMAQADDSAFMLKEEVSWAYSNLQR